MRVEQPSREELLMERARVIGRAHKDLDDALTHGYRAMYLDGYHDKLQAIDYLLGGAEGGQPK